MSFGNDVINVRPNQSAGVKPLLGRQSGGVASHHSPIFLPRCGSSTAGISKKRGPGLTKSCASGRAAPSMLDCPKQMKM